MSDDDFRKAIDEVLFRFAEEGEGTPERIIEVIARVLNSRIATSYLANQAVRFEPDMGLEVNLQPHAYTQLEPGTLPGSPLFYHPAGVW